MPWIRHTTRVVEGRGMILKPHINSVLVADGSEQTLTETTALAKFSGYVDLSNMQAADQVRIRQYVRVRDGGPLNKYADTTYKGVRDPAVLYITVKVLGHGCRITLEQTAGAFKSFNYSFAREEE